MNRTVKSSITVALLLTVVLLAGPATAVTVTERARTIFQDQQDTVLTIKLVVEQEMSFGGREGTKTENKSEVVGTVIDPSGLMIASLSATDPSGTFKKMMSNMSMGQSSQMDFHSELTDLKMILPDGTELPAEVVLRDTDLDLAFIRPKEAVAEPLAALDLSKRTTPKILDHVVVLHRLGKVVSRTPAVSLARIAARVEKPRTLFILDEASNTFGLGTPVFSMTGAPIGVVLLRAIQTQSGAGWAGMFSGGNNFGIMPIVLPFEEVIETAKQVPPREKKEPAETEQEPATPRQTTANE